MRRYLVFDTSYDPGALSVATERADVLATIGRLDYDPGVAGGLRPGTWGWVGDTPTARPPADSLLGRLLAQAEALANASGWVRVPGAQWVDAVDTYELPVVPAQA